MRPVDSRLPIIHFTVVHRNVNRIHHFRSSDILPRSICLTEQLSTVDSVRHHIVPMSAQSLAGARSTAGSTRWRGAPTADEL